MAQARDLRSFDAPPRGGRTWRVAHLSDLHTVGERYGFRVESGRLGPRGNGRLHQVLARLDEIHATEPLDLILLSGDMTDAGVSADQVVKAARAVDRQLIERVEVFDLYEGQGVPQGNKSLAIAVRLQPKERTLTDAEIDAIAQKIVSAVAKATGGMLRH